MESPLTSVIVPYGRFDGGKNVVRTLIEFNHVRTSEH